MPPFATGRYSYYGSIGTDHVDTSRRDGSSGNRMEAESHQPEKPALETEAAGVIT